MIEKIITGWNSPWDR